MRQSNRKSTATPSSVGWLLLVAFLLRLVVMLYSVFHDRYYRVKFTDIDYMIITDGAEEMVKGGSPFNRTTFRYTPLLAVLMVPNVLLFHHLGKLIFALCDIGAGYYCYQTLLCFTDSKRAKWLVCTCILFNPVVINISTRGNSDMIVTFMSMAVLANFVEKRYILAAAWLGFAIHFKIYPLIYAAPLVFGLWQQSEGMKSFGARIMLVVPRSVLCGLVACVFFAMPTLLCYVWYGDTYLDEAFFYHFRREDHRHNFSPYWLLMYLNMAQRFIPGAPNYSAGFIAFIPQFVILLWVSWSLRKNITHACCVQTILFIGFNKVVTVQYFVWFIAFLPFVFAEHNQLPKSTQRATFGIIVLWALTIPAWVIATGQFEFEGRNTMTQVWSASAFFFVMTVLLAAWVGRVSLAQQQLTMLVSGKRKKQ